MARVLVISPHMDDEVLGCGGTIARHADQGDVVTVCVVCNRAYKREYDDDAIQAEKQNAFAAKAILGYHELLFLDLPDEQLYAHFQALLTSIEPVVQQVCPEVAYLPHAGDLHQDHRTVAHAANIALRSISASFVRRILAYEIPSSTDQVFPGSAPAFAPNVYLDITNHLERKLAAMAAYQRESRPFPHPRSPEMQRAHAQRRGAQCGAEAAEAYMLLRELR